MGGFTCRTITLYGKTGTAMAVNRDYSSPQYRAWRDRVYKRDHYRCQMPGCPGADKRLNAHHIKRWATCPSLRFNVRNGITLCRTCHDRIHGLEEEYESVFLRIVNPAKDNTLLAMMAKRYEPKEESP